MSKAKMGDRVKIHYTGYLKDGTVIESTVTKGPIVVTIGEGTTVRGIEKAVIGMKEGDIKSIQVPPEDAYGEHKENLITAVDRAKLAGNIDLEIGMKLMARTKAGIMKNVTVCAFSEKSVIVDGNHHLAGQELAFEITLVEIMDN